MYRIGKEEIQEVAKVIEAKDLFKVNDGIQESRHVEEKIKELFGCDYSIFMTSGHAALTSALVAGGIGPGDEVIVPAYTYIATAMAVVAAGAIPVIAEVDETLTICPKDLEAKITEHTKAIIPVHIQGFPCDMDAIMAIAQKYKLFVLEDACQADGGKFRGKRLGTIGNAGALSFNFFKIITCGEGGALLTNEKKLYEGSLIYHDSSAIAYFGNQMEDFETEVFCGQEFRCNEICAAVLNVQLSRMDQILEDNRKNKKYLMEALKEDCKFIPSNDIDGDCGTTLAVMFETEEEARAFATAEGVNGGLPIDTGKHVYKNWTPVMEKRGAFHPLMDPFKMKANEGIIPEYSAEMCPQTLDLLSRVVYIGIDPNKTIEQLDNKIKMIKAALKK